ncbi:hypothetical protein GOODEAATRI_020697 [Goodea atripinnis]|uniref:Uncharacterized protein n=1 Tax=Goodea atripinnis TaxID=208336 RepID=A0ABV0PQA3_9TELE
MPPSPTAVNVAMEISRSAPRCCLRERERVHASLFPCLRALLIFNCHPQSASRAQSVIQEAQCGANSWSSFTSVLMDFFCLCLTSFHDSPPLPFYASLSLSFCLVLLFHNHIQI